jgi:signal transduction histidine kinase
MNLDSDSPKSLQWTLRCAEWSLLLVTPFIYVISFESSPDLLIKCLIFNALLLLLSFVFPLHCPLWQRRAYVLLEIILISVGLATGLETSFLLYFLLIKSCFLLSRRDVIITIMVGGVGCLVGVFLSYPSLVARQIDQAGFPANLSIFQILLTALIYYITIGVFVLLLGFVIMAERQSRQRAEALSREVETLAVNLERIRIAREIHDSLGHTFTALGIQLELAQRMRDRNLADSFRSVDNATLLASQGLQDVRQLVQTMRQTNFDLNDALQETIEHMRHQGTGIHLYVDLNMPPLSLQISHQLYCIIKEGLMNVQKHSQASHVTLSGQAIKNELVINLRDDGQGFDLVKPAAGCGLQGMEERVKLLGGSLKIGTAPNKGTHIQARIPYDSSVSGR